jgi:hypothetical protein
MDANLQHVQSVRIAEVTAANLSAHVPTVEGVRRELNTSAVKPHVRDSWQGVPA